MFFSQQWADGVRDVLDAGPDEEALAKKLQEYWDFYTLVRFTYPVVIGTGCPRLPAELGGGNTLSRRQVERRELTELPRPRRVEPVDATYVLAADQPRPGGIVEGYDVLLQPRRDEAVARGRATSGSLQGDILLLVERLARNRHGANEFSR